MDLTKNQDLLKEIDGYTIDHDIYNTLCEQLNWPVTETKRQYKLLNGLLAKSRYGRRWAYDNPVFRQKINLPGFFPTLLDYDLYITKANLPNYIGGLYELTETLLMIRLSPYINRFIDVGANVGYFSFLMAQQGKEVIAFEASSATYRQLVKGAEHNGLKLKMHQNAVGEASGTQDFYLHDDPGRNSLCQIGDAKETVKVVALDDYAGPDTMVKIDVENYEEYVLKGMKKWLASPDRPIILLESWPPYDKRVLPELQRYYKVFTVSSKPRHGSAPLLALGSRGQNFLALPREYDIFDPIDMRVFTPAEKLENLLYFLANNWCKKDSIK